MNDPTPISFGTGKVLILDPCQVWDSAKGCFYVGLAPHGRHPEGDLYVDAFGRQIVVRHKQAEVFEFHRGDAGELRRAA